MVRPWRGDHPDDLLGREAGVVRRQSGHTVRSRWQCVGHSYSVAVVTLWAMLEAGIT